MAEEEDSGDKPHDPSPRKLEKAREKGEVTKSQDLSVAAAYGGLCIASMGVGGTALTTFGTQMQALLDRPEELSALLLSPGGETVMGGLIARTMSTMAPIFLLPAALVLAVLFAQQAIVFAPSKLELKVSRLSPIANAKQKFGRAGIFEFLKSFVKLGIYSGILFYFVTGKIEEMSEALYIGSGAITVLMLRLSVEFLMLCFGIALAIGGIDFLWQRAEFMRRNRMSDKEIRDEHKEAEGDPYIKAMRRQKAEQIAKSQMMADVPKADVVIVNPTHYAVALKWDRMPGSAPEVVAKGVDEIAATIREIAAANGVPIHRDPPTARKLHAEVEIGQQIAPDDYRAVAAAIRFADRMRQMAKGRI